MFNDKESREELWSEFNYFFFNEFKHIDAFFKYMDNDRHHVILFYDKQFMILRGFVILQHYIKDGNVIVQTVLFNSLLIEGLCCFGV